MNNIVILGHSGFVGGHLYRHLICQPFTTVIGCSLPEYDLTCTESAQRIRDHLTPDTVLIISAALKRQFGDTLESFHANMAITENICGLLSAAPIKKVLFMSSAAVYGEETNNLEITETTNVNPTSFYGIAKYSSERLLQKICQAVPQSHLITLRPPLIYGPNDHGQTYGPSGFLSSAVAGSPITLWGDGSELREFIFIEDLVKIISILIDSNFSGEVNIVNGHKYCFADIITILKQIFPSIEVRINPRSKQKADNAFNPQLLKSLLPTTFRFTPLENGIKRMLDGDSC